MTHKILRSSIASEEKFAELVEIYIDEATKHAVHMALVAKGEADPYPAPVAHPDIAAAARPTDDSATSFVADYQIVDRFPIEVGDQAALDARKEDLRAEAMLAESKEIAAIMSPAKKRLLELDTAEAWAKDEEDRTDADSALIAELADVNAAQNLISRRYLTAMIAIEDLTFDNVDEWSLA